MRHARLQKLQRFRLKMLFYSFLILCAGTYKKLTQNAFITYTQAQHSHYLVENKTKI